MQTALDLLIDRLSEKNIIPLEIPRLLKDVVVTVRAGRIASVDVLNLKLSDLGWNDHTLDETILDLIVFLMESDGNDRFHRHAVH